MGLLDDAVSGLRSSNLVSDASTKVSEMASSVGNAFGSEGPFSKIGANLPTIDSLKAAAMRAGSILTGGTGALVNQAIQNDASRLSGGFTASSMKAAAGVSTLNNDHVVSLQEVGNDTEGGWVVFEVMPSITEARTVDYEAVQPWQFPGAFQKYKFTASVQWPNNAMFIARTSDEATANLHYLNRLRGWTMPYFGSNTAAEYKGKLGAPPPVLELSGLRKSIIGPVNVVITSLNWEWPKDVDYLPTNDPDDTGNAIPFPSVMTVAVQCVESWSITQFNQFSLSDYRNGDMFGAFNTIIDTTPLTIASPESGNGAVADAPSDSPDQSDAESRRLSSQNAATPEAPAPVAAAPVVPEVEAPTAAQVPPGYHIDRQTGLLLKPNGDVDPEKSRDFDFTGIPPDSPLWVDRPIGS